MFVQRQQIQAFLCLVEPIELLGEDQHSSPKHSGHFAIHSCKCARSLLEQKEFVGGLPSRLNRIMDAITNQELEVKVKAVDAKLVMEGLQKIANRITTGIVLGALILGACMLMRVESSFQLLGYPGLAILCFVLAAAGGFWLVITILVKDHRSRKKPPQ